MKWKKQWNSWIDPRPVLPGIYRRKEGGYLARGRYRDPASGKRKEIRLTLMGVTEPALALVELRSAVHRARLMAATPAVPLFCDYAVSLLERKLMIGEIRSAQGREKWGSILEHHLIPAFGNLEVPALRRVHVEAWRADLGRRIRAGELAPSTANTRLAVLRVVVNTAVAELELDRNPLLGVKPFDTSEHPTYTDEEPNALVPEEVPVFLAKLRALYPQHFAMVALGFATGLRPSTLRPLRRRGDHADVLWDDGVLLVRRSHTLGQEIMNTTKTKRRQRLTLPDELMEILREHAGRIDAAPLAQSDLLFPSRTGGLMSRSALDKPFANVTKGLGLDKHVTPRAMRRTFQDLARAAEVSDVVTRAVSGHATEVMQRHYSTVGADEMKQSLAKVVSLALVRSATSAPGGYASGVCKEDRDAKAG